MHRYSLLLPPRARPPLIACYTTGSSRKHRPCPGLLQPRSRATSRHSPPVASGGSSNAWLGRQNKPPPTPTSKRRSFGACEQKRAVAQCERAASGVRRTNHRGRQGEGGRETGDGGRVESTLHSAWVDRKTQHESGGIPPACACPLPRAVNANASCIGQPGPRAATAAAAGLPRKGIELTDHRTENGEQRRREGEERKTETRTECEA